jgi:hypothetical protein
MKIADDPATETLSRQMRDARVGDLVKAAGAGRVARGLEATAIVVPGTAGLGAYADGVERRRADFAAWDGRVVVLAGDGEPEHLVAIVDRYGQVYDKTSARDVESLPDPDALEEWFKFLAIACPECGVIDDPRERDWVP